MRILLISGMYPRDGRIAAEFIHRQMVEVRRSGVQVHVISPQPRLMAAGRWRDRLRQLTRRAEEVAMDGVHVTYLPYVNPPRRLSPALLAGALEHALIRHIRNLRRTYDFSLIHANHLFPIGYAALRVAERLNVPAVLAARGSDVHTNPHRNREVGRLTRAALRRAPVYAVSAALARQVAELEPSSGPVRVVRNGVDVDRFRPMRERTAIRTGLGLPAEGVVFCTVARLVPEKGIAELLMAFRSVVQAFATTTLVLVGDGPLAARLAARARQLGISDRVVFSGRRPQAELPLWLNAADAFVLPSHNEGLPNVVLEAMACGLPVIATDVGGVREAVVDARTGILVEPRQAAPLASALVTLCANAQLRVRLGHEGLRRIRQRFLWSHSASQLVALYREVEGFRAGLVDSPVVATAPRETANRTSHVRGLAVP